MMRKRILLCSLTLVSLFGLSLAGSHRKNTTSAVELQHGLLVSVPLASTLADADAKATKEESEFLVPGSGFGEATAQPDPRGKGIAADAKAIARWDVIPFVTFNSTINVGVVAFHINNIEKVSFSVNGGPWKDVTSMTRNPETNVVEYWTTLRAKDFSDGQIEVRAIAYPVSGVPRVLQGEIPFLTTSNTVTTNGEHSIRLFANGGETHKRAEFYVSPSQGDDKNPGTVASPVSTLSKGMALASAKDGSRVIILDAGQYNPDREGSPQFNNTRWITVEAGPGLTRDKVEIIGTGNNDRILPRISLIHWQNLTFRPDTYAYINESAQNNGTFQWYDNCVIMTPTLDVKDVHPWRSNVYVTRSRVENYPYGFVCALLVRDSAVKDTLDAYQRSQLILNSHVERMRASALAEKHHPDVYQTWGEMQNVIIYGMNGDEIDGTQVIFINQPLAAGAAMTDAAFVDMNLITYDKKGGPPFSQLQGPLTNLLFQNVRIPKQTMLMRADLKKQELNSLTAKDVVFEKCEFHNKLAPSKIPKGIIFK